MKKYLTSIFFICLSRVASADSAALHHDYSVFENKCSQCHSPSRVIDSDQYVLPSKIHTLVETMASKPGANISGSQQNQIYDFLTYYMAIKKTPILKQALENLPEQQRNQEIQKIKDVNDKYK